ncbi:MAG: carboxypeptidase-like regulatory domain-containing protein, partial [bacterium]|nr:carboxypeptidase-like regulatory domain-containing protein [bacterium]
MPTTNLKPYLLFLMISVFAVSELIAGITGKISGRAIDKQTREPLPLVNIQIMGTTRGAATDMNGYYNILLVPPGSYSLRATMVGYQSLDIKSVVVRVDQTTRIDFLLTAEVMDLGGFVKVVAERPVIQKDL